MPSDALLGEIMTTCCKSLPVLTKAGKADRIVTFIRAGAWLDATLAIMECELPQWSLRRILYEDGEWHCSLSSQPDLLIEFDETADGHHDVLPLAMLMAFVEGCRRAERATRSVVSKLDRKTMGSGIAMCCDNFA